jgi:hypothetical protein
MRHAHKRRRRPTNSRESVQGIQHFRRVHCQPIDLTHKTRPKHHISRLKTAKMLTKDEARRIAANIAKAAGAVAAVQWLASDYLRH